MKNKQIIMWLLCFFPYGVYLMFKHTNWTKKKKYIITGIGTFILGIGAANGGVFLLLLLSGLLLLLIGLSNLVYSFFKKTDIKPARLIVVYGLLFTIVAGTQINKQTQAVEAERVAEEQRIEQEEIAEQKIQEEIARQEEEKRIASERMQEATTAVKLAEEKPTQENFDKASTLVKALTQEDQDLISRLETIKPAVEEYELKLAEAREAVENAEQNKDRGAYDAALLLTSSLPVRHRGLENRLVSIDNEITKVEEEKAQAEKIAAEKAEEERIAKEKAETERIAKEKTAAQSKSSQSSGTSSGNGNQSSSSDDVEQTVFVAPHSGKKYHFTQNCRGLSNANAIESMTLSTAKSQGYTLCGWED